MQHFQKSDIPKLNRTLSHDVIGRQILKICFACKKGFCSRKGRAKAEPVANEPGRFVCQRCVDEMLNGKTNANLRLLQCR